MASKSVKKNYIFNLCYQILLLVTPLITTPYVTRALKTDCVGAVSFTESVASYFVLAANMGIAIYGQREISYVQDSKHKRSVVFWNTKFLSAIVSLAVLAIYGVFLWAADKGLLYVIMGLNILSVMVDITWFFQGLEEFGKIVIRNFFVKFVSVISIFVFVKSPKDVYIYAAINCVCTFLGYVTLWGYMPKYIEKISLKELHPFKDIKVVLTLFIPTVAIQVYTVLDKTMIGVITKSNYENANYDQAIKLSKAVLMIVTALGTVMIPRIGYYFEQKKYDEVKRLMYRGYRFVWFLGIPLCVCLIFISPFAMPWFLDPEFDQVSFLLKLFALLVPAIGISNVTGMQYLIPTKKQNIFTATVIIGACSNFVLNMLLIPHFKAVGAAIASVAAEIIVSVVQLIFVRKELSGLRVLREGVNYYIAGVLMATALYFTGFYLEPSVIATFIMAAVGGMVYVMALFILKDSFFVSNVKQIFGKVFKRR